MIHKLLEPQIPHARNLLDSIYFNGYAIDKSMTGTGKTYVASAIAAELNCPTVVICPKIVVPVWKSVLHSFGVKGALVINYEKIARGNTKWLKYIPREYFKKKNWESRGIVLNFPKNAFVILDEVHKCRGKDSLNSDLLIACKNKQYKCLAMSASLATSILELKAIGYMANIHNGVNFGAFCKQFGAKSDGYGGLKLDTFDNVKGMIEVHENLFNVQKSTSRMTVDMFDGIFPDNHVVAEAFDMGNNTEKINAIYDQMERELDALDKRSESYSQHVFAIIMKARRHSELLKIPSLVETVQDWYEEGISPVIFLNFTDSLQSLESRLLQNPKLVNKIAKIVGGQSEKTRTSEIGDFNADVKRIMLVNIGAGNAGVSLHDLNGKYPRNSLIIPNFSAVTLLQALGRIPRQGGKTRCLQKIVFSSGTYEETACERVQSKLDNLTALSDGDLMGRMQIYGTVEDYDHIY